MAFKKKPLKNMYQIISAAYQITKASWQFAKDLKENSVLKYLI